VKIKGFERLIRQTLTDLGFTGYMLSAVDVPDVPGLLCFVVSFLSRGRKPLYVYLDSHEDDETHIVSDVARQLSADETVTRVRRVTDWH
jgi:hypothetical protein